MPKERSRSIDPLKKKLRRLEKKLSRTRSRSRSPLSTYSLNSYWEQPVYSEKETSEDVPQTPITPAETETAQKDPHPLVDLTDKAEADISEDVLALLGEAPEEVSYGPDLLPQLCTHWQAIIKKGLDKDDKNKLIKKYPPPGNCIIIDAPKLNPEAQAAAGEGVIKRDKAIEAKQKQVSCALTAIGLALHKVCKTPSGNEEIITLLSDSARLLCDYHHGESSTRKLFVLTGLENKTARDALKDTEVDQWLFGTELSEKLKASKAIERTSKDLKGPVNKPKRLQTPAVSNLNFKGPTNNAYKPRGPGQKPVYQPFQRKPPVNASAKPYQQKSYPQKHHRQHYSRR